MRTTALLILALAACTLPTMPVKPDLAAGAQTPFDRPLFSTGSRVRFGAFHVDDVDRTPFSSSSSSTSVPLLFPDWLRSVGEFQSSQDYAFSIAEEGQPPRAVRCRAEMKGSKVELRRTSVTSFSQSLHCAVALDASAREYARLDLLEGGGEFAIAGRKLAIEGRDLLGRRDPMDPSGFVLIDGDREIAAAQTVNAGAAWIARDLDAQSRSLAAAAVAALLLYRAPSPD
jgi:hypothetical protein